MRLSPQPTNSDSDPSHRPGRELNLIFSERSFPLLDRGPVQYGGASIPCRLRGSDVPALLVARTGLASRTRTHALANHLIGRQIVDFMNQQRKRTELAERRAAERLRGRQRLEQARESALGDLLIIREMRKLPDVLDGFLTQYAAHHLTQVFLREGQDSAAYTGAIGAINGLMTVYDEVESGASLERAPPLERSALVSMLGSSGLHDAAADEIMGALEQALHNVSASGADRRAIDPPPPPIDPVVENRWEYTVDPQAMLDLDVTVLERMRALDVGTWIELTNDGGRTDPAKVSWISPISSRLLFINRRGVRILVASPEELAAMAKTGRVRLRDSAAVLDGAR